MTHRVRFHRTCLPGLEAMMAESTRSFPRHTHDQYGIGTVDRGGHASASDARQVEAGPGNLIFVNPGEVHDGRAVGGAARSWRMLYFDPALLREARDDVLEGDSSIWVFPAAVATDPALRVLFDSVYAWVTHAQDTLGRMVGETAVLRLAAHLQRRRVEAGQIAPPIGRARERIDANPAAPLTLADLAGEAGLSRYQLHRGFVRELGLTPHAYILQQRVALARRLVREGTPLADAAVVAGFYDQSHLNRWFSRSFGISPGRYARWTP